LHALRQWRGVGDPCRYGHICDAIDLADQDRGLSL